MLLSCFLLPGGICPCCLLTAEALAAHSTFPHAPACASILTWQRPLATAAAAQSEADFVWKMADFSDCCWGVGCWLLALLSLLCGRHRA